MERHCTSGGRRLQSVSASLPPESALQVNLIHCFLLPSQVALGSLSLSALPCRGRITAPSRSQVA